MRLIDLFVNNPVKVTVGVILLVMFGVLALFRMPMQLVPEVNIPTITIETRWSGASPKEVEREIVLEQEKQLKSVEGVTKMSSESMDSTGRITLEFKVGTDMREALLKVNTRLQQVKEYPIDADEPVLKTANLSDRPIAWFMLTQRMKDRSEFVEFQQRHPQLKDEIDGVMRAEHEGVALYRLREVAAKHPEAKVLLPDDVDITELRKFAEDVIEARFERVVGVSDANVLGGREEEMQVIVDPAKLAARGLTIGDVRNALRAQNNDTSGGDFWAGKRRYVVRTLGQFRKPEQIADTVIAYRGWSPVYVRDVVEPGGVKKGFKKPDGLIRRFGSEYIAINAVRETNANILDVMDGLRGAVKELNEGVLKQRGLKVTQVYDETEYIYSAIDLVTENLLVGAVLTFITLLLFLKSGRSTIIIFIHILVSTVGAFLVMYMMGRSLNVLALGGLAFAVGMLVDNAIVMLENIYRRYQNGESPTEASVRGAGEVWPALLNATLANLAVFLPVLFVQEEAGQLFRDIALAICAAVGLSMLVAVMVVPTAAKRLLRERPKPSGPLGSEPSTNGEPRAAHETNGEVARLVSTDAKERPRSFLGRLGQGWSRFIHAFLAPLDWLGGQFVRGVVGVNAWLQNRTIWRLTVILIFVGAAGLFTWLLWPKVEYLPSGNRNLVIAILMPPPGYNVRQMLQMGEEIEQELKPYWNVDPGSPEAKALKYPAIGDYFFVARGRQLFIGLRAAEPNRAQELIPLLREAMAKAPSASGTFSIAKQTSLFEQGLSAGRTVDIEIRGPDERKLVGLAFKVMGQVQTTIPGSQAFPQPSLDLSSPEVHIIPDGDKMAQKGLTADELGYTVDALVDGAYATDFYEGGDKIDIRILAANPLRPRIEAAEDIANPKGLSTRWDPDRWLDELRALPIATRTGGVVPLESFGAVSITGGPEQINRRERQRAIVIQVTPPREVALEDAMDRINREIVQPMIDSGELEGGEYHIALGGTADKLSSTWKALRFNILLALVITYLCMAATFESWLYPFVVILSVPIGAVGGFAGLWLLNQFTFQALDVLTMLGFVMLIGTVVNNPILIVEQALVHMREEHMPMRQAILESVRTRIRPIFMTTLGGLVGLLPLVVSPGPGSELYRGIGAVLLGGLLVSTLVTLILVPTLFSLMMEIRGGLARMIWGRPQAEVNGTPAVAFPADPQKAEIPATTQAVRS